MKLGFKSLSGVVMAIVMGAGFVQSAEAASLRITCASEDDGRVSGEIKHDEFTHTVTNRGTPFAEVRDYKIGTLLNGMSLVVDLSLDGYSAPIIDTLRLKLIPNGQTNVVAGMGLRRVYPKGRLLIGQIFADGMIDPEGLNCILRVTGKPRS